MKIITTKNITCSILEVGNQVKGYGKLTSPKCYIFSEDKINLLTQIEIAKSLDGGFFNIENLTFKKYIAEKRGDNVLSNEASTMAIRKIIQDNKKSLKCFNASKSLSNLAKTLFELISQLKSANVSCESIESLLQNEENSLSTNLYNKLFDVNLIYTKYQDYLKNNNLFDSYEYLKVMPDLIKNDQDIKNSTVIVVGYTNITKQRELIFKALNDICKEFIAIVISDNEQTFYTNEVLNKLKPLGCEIIESQFNSTINGDALILQQRLYNKSIYKNDYKKPKTNSITLSTFKTPYDEIEHIAVDIINKVKEGIARYKDVAVTIGNLNEYSTIVKRIFSKYGIPFYIDDTKVLSDHPLTYFILDAFELARKNLSISDVKNFARNFLFISDKTLQDGFCNYLDKYSITRKTIKEPFIYQDENILKYEQIRLQIIEVEKLFKNSKTVRHFVDAIKSLLKLINVEEKLQILNEQFKKDDEQALIDFNDKVLDKLDKILNELLFVINDSAIDVTDFKNLFLSGTDACKISGIPLYMDAVFVSNLIDVKLKSPVLLYAVGICGDIPSSKSDIALLSDKDIDKLCSERYEKYQVSVEPKIQLVNKREIQNVCTTLISFKKELHVSYPILSNNGQINVKSDIVKNILAIFDIEINNVQNKKLSKIYLEKEHNLIIKSLTSPELAIEKIIKLLSQNKLETALESQLISLLYTTFERLNLSKQIEVLDNLLKKQNKFKVESENSLLCIKNKEISATTLEGYYSCPFANFAKGSLKLKEKEDGEINTNERGNVLHEVLEKFISRLNEVSDKTSCDNLVVEIFDNVISQQKYQVLTSKPKYVYLFSNLKQETLKIAYNLYLSSKKTLFKPMLLEEPFGEKCKIKGIPLNTKIGTYSVKGKVDRVDEYNNKIRIIDYKSGNYDVSPTLFYVGKKLQLYLYMNAFLNNGHTPAGAYYSPIDMQFSSSRENQIELHGRTIDDEDVIQATDVEATKTKRSTIFNGYTKDGKLNKAHAFLSKSEFYDFLDYSKLISANAINEISTGFIEPTPYTDSCTFCKFNGMCGFCINEDGKFRKAGNVTKSTIIDAVKNSTKKEQD